MRQQQPGRSLRRAPWGDRSLERKIALEDAALEVAQFAAWIEAELFCVSPPKGPVRRERVRLPSGAVETEHQAREQPLAERVLASKSLELPDEVGAAAELELAATSASKATRRRSSSRSASTLIGGSSARSASARPRHSASASRKSVRAFVAFPEAAAAPLLKQSLESLEVELARFDVQNVAGRVPLNSVASELRPQTRNVAVERSLRARRRALAPEHVDQPVAGDDLVRVEKQQGEQRPLLGTAQRRHPAVDAHLKRAEDRELHSPS